ncbi:unnamed protein product [Parnassius apollo]|uniref:(apollo) hypothetical protein n=1 Tax=Parnassius apollo TaxID=110799 RepID=A0A8S3Y9F5_PARAO|nr:unnamed protein product [Parnassius apollo]
MIERSASNHDLLVLLKIWLEPKTGICRCETRLDGKVALVTGGNSGIGLETARDLAKRGARVIIASRNTAKSEQAVTDIIATTGNKNVEYRSLNLCKFSSVINFADDFNKTVNRLDILVNNAGCVWMPHRTSDDGIDLVMQTNHLGPFLLTNLLMDKLISSKPSRIVIVSSYLHNFGRLDLDDIAGINTAFNRRLLGNYLKYANSKLSNVLWMKALAKRLPNGVTVNALHPGVVTTDIYEWIPSYVRKILNILMDLIFKNAKEGAQTTIHLCVCEELTGFTGGYYKDCKLHPYHKICDDVDFVDMFWDKCILLTSRKQN